MQIGTNAVTISNPALAKILGKSPRTIARATKHLVDHAFVQVIKTKYKLLCGQRASGVLQGHQGNEKRCSLQPLWLMSASKTRGGLR
ncbi:hypothetical protein [Klebsiella michiganensis]|uniref:hypothetical protein n=1 Tax=Klebsiella michiganensis TaxID=1134687 RepID=UPI0039779431